MIINNFIVRLIFGTLSCFLVAAGGCGEKAGRENQPLKKIMIGSVPAIVEVVTHVAHDKGFFKENGLDTTLLINPDGKTSLQNLFDGTADIIHVMATPVVYASFKRNDFYIIGKINHSTIHFAVARTDHGILEAADLKGKRLAVTKGTSGEFYMDSFLIYNGINPARLDIQYMDAPRMVDAIEKGTVDAIFCWSPFPQMAKERLGANGIMLPNLDIVPSSWLVIAKKEFAIQNPDVIKKYLQGLYRAEQFIAANKEEALRIHSKISGTELSMASGLFERMTLKLGLDQALLNDLEDQARWIIRYQYTEKTEMPNFLNLIYEQPLKDIKPDSVSIIK